jgi:hypothetical protein
MNCPHHPNTPALVYCPECRAIEEKVLVTSDATDTDMMIYRWNRDATHPVMRVRDAVTYARQLEHERDELASRLAAVWCVCKPRITTTWFGETPLCTACKKLVDQSMANI